MYNLQKFTLQEMTQCGIHLRELNSNNSNMEEVANKIVNYFYENFINQKTNEKDFALVRFFKTHSYENLELKLQEYAQTMRREKFPSPQTKCLTLLATRGILSEWNSRYQSIGHQAIPLASEQLVSQAPMISQLLQQFGLKTSTFLNPDIQLLVDLEQKIYNVFYIPRALGSKHIPAQEKFVIPYQIQSVLGFGGMLPDGNLFTVILFSRVHISQDTATLFKVLALSVKMAILPFTEDATFTNI